MGEGETKGGATAALETSDPLVGTVIADRYRVEALIGEGGMGSVYRVEHLHMRKRLALKVLHRELSTYDEVVARFEREAMAASAIEHPNIANATDFGKLADGSFYLVLEYVEGVDLRTVLQRERFLNPARAVHIMMQILGALGRAHELGIVHRDLKPENVLLVEKDGDPEFVKVLDFGIARVPVGSIASSARANDARPLTKAGTVYGTPEYMAPEQALGHQVDGRADLYACGILLFEMCAGARPYDDVDKIALLGAHVSKPIPKLSQRAPKDQFIPDGVESAVTRLLAKSPDDRYANAREVSEELLHLGFDAPMPITRHPSQRGDLSGAHPMPQGSDSRPSGSKILLSEPIPLSSPRVAPTAEPSTKEPLVLDPPPRASRVPWVIAVLALGVAAGAVFMLRQGTIAPTTTPPPSVSASASSAPPAASSVIPVSDLKEQSLRALGRIASGEVEAGIKDLEAVAQANPSDPAILRALAQGYGKAKRPLDALAAIRKLVAIAPGEANDPLLGAIFEDALADPKASDEAVTVLLGPMGTSGAKWLYDFAWSDRGVAAARGRASRALRDPKLTKGLAPGMKAAIELKAAPTCMAKRAVTEKYRKSLDAIALPTLEEMAKPTCGPAKKTECWPCFGAYLETLLKETRARAAAGK